MVYSHRHSFRSVGCHDRQTKNNVNIFIVGKQRNT